MVRIDVSDKEIWHHADSAIYYRFLPEAATYGPADPWPGSGRFDVDSTPTLYVAETSEGAVAEYYRRHPELLQVQASVKLNVFEVEIACSCEGTDVRMEEQARKVGIAWDRLRSSDRRKQDRYKECYGLADETVKMGGVSVQYPSAAYEGAQALVLFAVGEGWTASAARVDTPSVMPERVRALPSGAEP